MEPQHDFGKEAAEWERLRNEKRKKMKKRTITISLVILLLSSILVFWGDLKNVVASSSGTNPIKKSKKNKGDEKLAVAYQSADDAITIANKWELPKVLTEISGLSYLSADRFACVQDEQGIIFIYNTSTNSIEKEIPFAGAGDYEGVAVVKNAVWVVRADGRLFEVNNFTTGKPAVKEYSTHLTSKQNVEGLCFDSENNRLLLAIKDAEPGNKPYKGIYAFDLAGRTMTSEPAFRINLEDAAFSKTTAKKLQDVIQPSSIAIHPVSKDMYITDGRKSQLLVLNPSGAVKKLYQLNEQEFAQPEGITFTPEGELYISNEGPKKPGNILHVRIR